MAPPVAVLDACVLVPPGLRDLLLWVAFERAYRPVWQDEILDETVRNGAELLVKKRKISEDEAIARLTATRATLDRAFPGARLPQDDWEPLVFECTNDPKDRHVLAAAIAGQANYIVTTNKRDFPKRSVPRGILVRTADEFLNELLDRDRASVVSAVKEMASQHRAPPQTPLELATQISTGVHAPRFGEHMVEILTS